MKKSVFALLLAGSAFLAGCKVGFSTCLINCDRVVDTSYGTISGKSDGFVNSFWGIPYAEPPVGNNRWRAPQTKQAWSGILNATTFSYDGCTQWSYPHDMPRSQQSEDCLVLNIWAPDKPGPHPVMVWVHGGGLQLGSSKELQYNGKHIARNQNVVVVSINYRLGPMGFLALPELTAEQGQSGNYGFLDQVAALQWVNDEIAGFGGDPGNITVFGESAGGISVCMLMASPLSRDLFHKAIIMSGLCDYSWPSANLATAEAHGTAFANRLGCTDSATRLDCLRNMTPDEMKDQLALPLNEMFATEFPDWRFIPYQTHDGLFIDDTLTGMLAAAAPKPVLIGVTEHDGSLFEAYLNHPEKADYLSYLTSRGFDAAAVAALYPITNYVNVGAAMADIKTDLLFKCSAVKLSDSMADGGYSVFQYQFTEYSDSVLRRMVQLLLGQFCPQRRSECR